MGRLVVDCCISRYVQDLAEALPRVTGDSGVDVVRDPVCGPNFATLIGLLRRRGRYASCGAIAGRMVSFDARGLIIWIWNSMARRSRPAMSLPTLSAISSAARSAP